MSELLKTRYKQQDFFVPDIFDTLPFKDDLASMEHPVFSLSTRPDFRVLEYKKDNVSIIFKPSSDGLPTIHDKDILLYCGSVMMAEVNKYEKALDVDAKEAVKKERESIANTQSEEAIETYLEEYEESYKAEQRLLNPIPKTLRISCHDLLVSTNRTKDGRGYALLKKALDRLVGTTIKTNIKTNRTEITEAFHLIDKYRVVESSRVKNRMVRLEITLADWFYNSFIGGEVLTINPKYFELRKPLERRLYELGRKHCGYQQKSQMHLKKFHLKTGSRSNIEKFRFMIKESAKDDHLPDYHIHLDSNDMVTYTRRNTVLPLFDRKQLSDFRGETIERARNLIEKSGTGWSFQSIVDQFSDHMEKHGNPNNINGAFIGFVKKKIANKP